MGHRVNGKPGAAEPLDAESAATVAATLQALATPSRLLILTRLRIPEHYQQRVLFFAILIALILRGSSSPSVPP